MSFKRGRYSGFIRPILYVVDTAFLTLFVLYNFPVIENEEYFIAFLIFGWFITAFFARYYNVYRFTKSTKIFALSFRQFVGFTLIFYSYFGFSNISIEPKVASNFLLFFFSTTLIVKFLMYSALKTYRLRGGNKRSTIIVGRNHSTKALEDFFLKKAIYGYNYLGFFTDKSVDRRIGGFEDCFEFIAKHGIDDIYCSISEFDPRQVEKLVKFANTNFKTLKFIPDSDQVLSSGFEVHYYDYFPVLALNEISLNNNTNRLLKRAFDIVFSLIIIIGLLSWLTPILFVLIKLESKGPLFYTRDRNGLDYKTFKCYKFRTLRHGNDLVAHIGKDDQRVTMIGKVLRKTSLDELPQFINVLKGEMSVVGPRPHMLAYNKAYADQVDNLQLMARHLILPGITGLAQIRGYRGEVARDLDIIGRVKLDLFYLKNWSLLLDIKIILLTSLKLFQGDDKAY